jgi:hypothetical protein
MLLVIRLQNNSKNKREKRNFPYYRGGKSLFVAFCRRWMEEKGGNENLNKIKRFYFVIRAN